VQKTGTEIISDALHEIKVLDPTATAEGERLADGQRAADYLLDEWRTDRLTISGVTIASYNLVSGQQTYTIGSGGDFNQEYPESIAAWNCVQNRNASDPIELPMGRPYNSDEWRGIRIKSTRGPFPSVMYFDGKFTAGLGNCLFYPIPDNNNVQVKLYTFVPTVTSLDPNTTYQFAPGVANALMLNLALALAGGYGSAATLPENLERRASKALAAAKRRNIRPKESPIRADFIIGDAIGRRNFNIYTGGR
jgi:hypothetical protein